MSFKKKNNPWRYLQWRQNHATQFCLISQRNCTFIQETDSNGSYMCTVEDKIWPCMISLSRQLPVNFPVTNKATAVMIFLIWPCVLWGLESLYYSDRCWVKSMARLWVTSQEPRLHPKYSHYSTLPSLPLKSTVFTTKELFSTLIVRVLLMTSLNTKKKSLQGKCMENLV